MSATDRQLVHGSCIAVGSRAVLFRGPSGAGKSDLALRCLSSSFLQAGAHKAGLLTAAVQPIMLVSDDQVQLHREGMSILAGPPAAIAGKIEVRGIGIVELAHASDVPLVLIMDLLDSDGVERMPETMLGGGQTDDYRHPSAGSGARTANAGEKPQSKNPATVAVLGLNLHRLSIAPFESSAPLKVLLALDNPAITGD